MGSQIIVFIVIAITLFLFIDGRLRYDFVSLLGLLVLTITKVIPPETSFMGFSHPAIITVASVLVISSALVNTGAIGKVVFIINKGTNNVQLRIMSLMIITATLSAFMNNVGALAIIMPIAITIAKDNKIAPSQLLMPVAFASLLGGMITGIGTPPNLIISTYRTQAGFEAFSFFSFAPVGITLSVLGIIFITLIGWRMIPKRKSQDIEALFNLEDYLSELVVVENCNMIGKTLKDFYTIYKIEMNVLSIIRNGHKIISPGGNQQLLKGDILIVKALSSELSNIVNKTCLALKGAKTNELRTETNLKSKDIELVEVVIRPDSLLVGRTALETRLRNIYNVNLIAVSRKGVFSTERLKTFKFQKGDVILIQVPKSNLRDTFSKLRCLPLAGRGVGINMESSPSKQNTVLGIFFTSVLVTTLGILPVQISFAMAAILLVILQVITPIEFYEAIEWPTIIMIGSLFSFGAALQGSGASDTIVLQLMKMTSFLTPSLMMVVLMLLTMSMTNMISSTATAILMGPIALSLAHSMGVSPDPLLMSITVAASSAFLTPIGHQSNMLVMEPGGYKFTDYWHLGLPLSIIIIVVGAPLILFLWPL